MYLGRSDLKLGVLPEELLKEAVSQGYCYVVGDYSLILEAEGRKVIIQSSGVLVEEKYYWRQLDYPYSYMTQELSKETGITARTIQRYESSPTNLRSASYKNLVLLANALNVTVDDFFLDNVSEFLKLPN